MRQILSHIVFLLSFLLCSFLSRAQVRVWNNPFEKWDFQSKPILFEPMSNIGYIKSGEKMEYSDSISKSSEHILSKTLQKIDSLRSYPILKEEDTAIANTLKYEINNIVNDERFKNDYQKWALPPCLDSLLMESNHTYGFVIFQNGFSRRKGNYSGQVWKSIGVGILTLGNYMYTPQKSSSNLYLFWLDGKKKTITCIAKDETSGKDPSDSQQISKQLKEILKNFKRPS